MSRPSPFAAVADGVQMKMAVAPATEVDDRLMVAGDEGPSQELMRMGAAGVPAVLSSWMVMGVVKVPRSRMESPG